MGQHPDWQGQILDFLVLDEKLMTVRVYVSKTKTSDKLLGEAVYSLDMIKSGKIKKQAVEVNHKGKKAATLQVEFQYWIDDNFNSARRMACMQPQQQLQHQNTCIDPGPVWWTNTRASQVPVSHNAAAAACQQPAWQQFQQMPHQPPLQV